MNPAIASITIQLLKTPASRALITKGIENIKPYVLNNDPPEEDSKWQDRLEKEREIQEPINEDPEKERGRGDKGRLNELENADNRELKDSKLNEVLEKGKENFIEKIKEEGQKNQPEIIKEEGTKTFQERLIDERGWSPDDGAKLDLKEPSEQYEFDSNETQLTVYQEQNFIQLAQMDIDYDPQNAKNIMAQDIPIRREFEPEFETDDVDMDSADAGDGSGDGD